MKKYTFILVFVLSGMFGLNAQKLTDAFVEKAPYQSYSVSAEVMVLTSDSSAKFTVNGKVLMIKDVEVGATIDIYSVLGAKVYSFVYKGTPETLNLSKGIYIAKVGNYTQKIIL